MRQKLTDQKLIKKKRRLSLSIFIVIVTFACFVFVTGYIQYHQDLKSAQKSLTMLATQLNEQKDIYFNNYSSFFLLLSEIEAVRMKDTTKLNKLFKKLTQRFNAFENLAAADENGFFFASGRPFNLSMPPNVSNLPFFQKAKKGDQFVVMDLHIGPISHEKVTGVIVRLENDTQDFDGVLGASIKISELIDRWVKFAIKNNADLFCYRRDKDIIYSSGIEESILNDLVSGEISNNKFELGNKQYLFLTLPFVELDFNLGLLLEFEVLFFKRFISNPLLMLVSASFIVAIIILLFLYRNEVVWLKLLMQKETLLSATQKLTKVGGWEWDVDTRAMYWTEETYRIHGFDQSKIKPGSKEHIDKSIECYNPEDRPVIQDAFQRCIEEGRPYDLEVPFTAVDGIKKWIKTSAEPELKNGKIAKIVGNILDISEHKQADEAIKKSESFQRKMVANIGDVIVIIDQDGINRYKSPNIEKQFDWKPEDVIGHSTLDNVHPEDLESAQKFIEALMLEPNAVGTMECRYKSKDGNYRWIEFTGNNLLHDPDIRGLLGNYHDITERKQTEKELAKSQKLYHAIFNKNRDGYVINWGSGELLDPNPAFAKMLGYSIDELKKITYLDLTPKKWVEWEAEVHGGKLLERGYTDLYEKEYIHKNGTVFPIEIQAFLLNESTDLNSALIAAFVRDITKRKQADEALKESEQRYRKAQRLGHVGNWEYNLVTEKFWGSDEAKRIYGFDPKSENFTTDDVENCIPERERVHQALIDLIENNKPYNLEFEIHPISGPQNKIVKSIADIIKDDSGAPFKVAGVIQDITQQKNAEKEKSILERHLQEAQKMEAIGTLAGGIAHDFNNILFPLVGYAEMLKEDLPADHPFQENADTMLSSALRARDLVQQILTFSRKTESEVKPIKLQSIVREAIKLLRPSIPKTIDINQSIDSECSPVNADSSKFHQVIMNLATNAYHAMEKEGGTLTITLKQIYIEQGSVEHTNILPGTYAYLTVADTGIGMRQNTIDKVYDPYFTTKEQGKGTGLGLSVVHGIIKEVGGDIRIQSEPGKGTQLHVYIPIIERRTVERVETTGPVIGGTERILLVDDEEAIASMEKQLLERLGYHVTTRTGSIEALEAFKANPDKYDFVITDMTMPNMTGIQLAREIKNIKVNIPIIICTGFSEQLTDEKCQALDIQGYAMKPVIIRELAETIRNALDTSGKS